MGKLTRGYFVAVVEQAGLAWRVTRTGCYPEQVGPEPVFGKHFQTSCLRSAVAEREQCS